MLTMKMERIQKVNSEFKSMAFSKKSNQSNREYFHEWKGKCNFYFWTYWHHLLILISSLIKRGYMVHIHFTARMWTQITYPNFSPVGYSLFFLITIWNIHFFFFFFFLIGNDNGIWNIHPFCNFSPIFVLWFQQQGVRCYPWNFSVY